MRFRVIALNADGDEVGEWRETSYGEAVTRARRLVSRHPLLVARVYDTGGGGWKKLCEFDSASGVKNE